MRYFNAVQIVGTTIVIFLVGLFWGVCMIPSAAILLYAKDYLTDYSLVEQSIGLGIAGGLAFISFGILSVLLSGVLGLITRPKFREGRVPMKSMTTIKWALSSIVHELSSLFLKMLSITWIGNLHYRMMGANLGKNVQINTGHLNDAWVISIGDGTVVGGNATINGHLTEKNDMVFAPVKIGKGCIIGGRSVINPGCTIGDGAVIAYNAILPKFTNVPAGEIWGGVPAKCIRRADGSKPE